MTTLDLRYPIGKFEPKENYTPEEIRHYIDKIASLPSNVEKVVEGLSGIQLDTPYREGGWTVRQVLHHLPDSHMNAFIRFKWTLTEDSPVIKAYDEKAWAETPETTASPKVSIELLKALHAKWIVLLKGLDVSDYARYFIHPETKKQVRLDRLIATYAWHGQHHLAQIESLIERSNW